jgi:hypothetical protein
MSTINIIFKPIIKVQSDIPATIQIPFKREDFIEVAKKALDKKSLEGLIFTVQKTRLDLISNENFDRQKSNVQDGSLVHVFQRIPGGNNLGTGILIDIVLLELPKEFSINSQSKECSVCAELRPCRSSCKRATCKDSWICEDCFTTYYKQNNMKILCPVCHNRTNDEDFFTPPFVKLIKELHDIMELLKNIDCQICICGALLVNDSLRPRSDCPFCHRQFCFFCNRKWNDATMSNDVQFTCKNDCVYEMYISYKLETYAFSEEFEIPNQRCCPKCCTFGAYDPVKCKYATCPRIDCSHKYCFLCLESETDCRNKSKTKRPSNTSDEAFKCSAPKSQDYSIFPRLVS